MHSLIQTVPPSDVACGELRAQPCVTGEFVDATTPREVSGNGTSQAHALHCSAEDCRGPADACVGGRAAGLGTARFSRR